MQQSSGILQLKRVTRVLYVVFALAMLAFHEYTTATLPLSGFMQTAVHLGFAMTIICLGLICNSESPKIGYKELSAIFIIILTLAFNIRILVTQGYIPAKITANLSVSDTILAVCAVLAILMVTRRVIGMSMVWVAVVFILYALFGAYFPGLLQHKGLTINRLLSATYLTVEGIYGSPLQVSASDVFPLMMFGGILVTLGGGDLLMGIAQKALGTVRGGIAKVAVLSSALFGMLSGAGPANAATTGAITIPMMKRNGYDAAFAGAVEATASIGGQVMPPIMGAAAFIMATNLNVSYGYLVLCAAPAAVLYYVAIYIAVDSEAQRLNLVGMARENIPSIKPLLRDNWHLLISIVVIITLLVGFGFGAGTAGFWATVVLVISEVISCVIRRRVPDKKQVLEDLVESVKNASSIAVSCACAGIILCVVDKSGLAIKMTSLMLSVTGGNIFLMLLMAAIASLIMGMALPTVACYIIVATMVAPSLINAGLDPFSAHFFAFYFGMISNITPPVALTAFVAAGIAKASPLKTATVATRLGVAGFILPFLFCWDPGVLLQGTGFEIVVALIRSTFVIVTTAFIVGGHVFEMRIPTFLRLLMLAGVACIFLPFTTLNIPSYIVIIGGFTWHYLRAKKMRKALN